MTAAERPRVGGQITTAEQLDALPVGSVLRTRSGALAETGDMRGKPSRVVWCEGWSEHADAIEYLAPFTVLYVPGEQSRPSVTDDGYCCTPDSGDCCGPGSWCCARAGKHEHGEDTRPSGITTTVTEAARVEARRRWPSYPAVGFSGADDRQAAFVAGAEWAAGRAETTTATTEDAARALFDQLWTEDRDYERAEVREIFLTGYESGVDAAAGLLATARTRPTEPTDAQVKRAAAALMDGDPEYENGTYGPDDYEAMARATLRAAWTEADQ